VRLVIKKVKVPWEVRIKKPVFGEKTGKLVARPLACADLDDVGMVLRNPLLPVVESDAEEVDGNAD